MGEKKSQGVSGLPGDGRVARYAGEDSKKSGGMAG